MLFYFFSQQTTAYELRISDWSSDVCSSDLGAPARRERRRPAAENIPQVGDQAGKSADCWSLARLAAEKLCPGRAAPQDPWSVIDAARRQRLSLFHSDAWSRAVGAHGREVALLAAALALQIGRAHV